MAGAKPSTPTEVWFFDFLGGRVLFELLTSGLLIGFAFLVVPARAPLCVSQTLFQRAFSLQGDTGSP